MKKMLFVVNPKAGKAQIKNKVLEVVSRFTAGGFQVTLFPTAAKLDARNIVREQGHRYDVIVCSGGDGTLDEVVSGLQEGDIQTKVGYIPAGSTNDYARSLGILKGVEQACEIILHGQAKALDVGQFNEDYFVYSASFGAFTEVSYQTSQMKKNLLGHLAYVLDGAKSLGKIQGYPMRLTLEDETITGNFIFGTVTNSTSIGGFKIPNTANILLDDGIFEFLLVREPKTPAELQGIITALMMGNFNHPSLVYRQKAKGVFHTRRNVPWSLDGEYGGTPKEIQVSCTEKAWRLMIPKEKKK